MKKSQTIQPNGTAMVAAAAHHSFEASKSLQEILDRTKGEFTDSEGKRLLRTFREAVPSDMQVRLISRLEDIHGRDLGFHKLMQEDMEATEEYNYLKEMGLAGAVPNMPVLYDSTWSGKLLLRALYKERERALNLGRKTSNDEGKEKATV